MAHPALAAKTKGLVAVHELDTLCVESEAKSLESAVKVDAVHVIDAHRTVALEFAKDAAMAEGKGCRA